MKKMLSHIWNFVIAVFGFKDEPLTPIREVVLSAMTNLAPTEDERVLKHRDENIVITARITRNEPDQGTLSVNIVSRRGHNLDDLTFSTVSVFLNGKPFGQILLRRYHQSYGVGEDSSYGYITIGHGTKYKNLKKVEGLTFQFVPENTEK